MDSKEDKSWRLKKNSKIDDLMSEPNILGEARLRWSGHMDRGGSCCKMRVLGIYLGLRYRWSDEVQID